MKDLNGVYTLRVEEYIIRGHILGRSEAYSNLWRFGETPARVSFQSLVLNQSQRAR
jgi:hypothetical protein